jgi:hypothetical protein
MVSNEVNTKSILNGMCDYMLYGKMMIHSFKYKLKDLANNMDLTSSSFSVLTNDTVTTKEHDDIVFSNDDKQDIVLSNDKQDIVLSNDKQDIVLSNDKPDIFLPKECKIGIEDVVTEQEPVLPQQKQQEHKKSSMFFPKQKDSLFWCFYIAKHGFSKYEFPNTTSFENEKTIKYECIYKLREKKELLKAKKVKNIKEDVEDDLGSKEKITMKTFLALCIVENLNVLYIHKRKCFCIHSNDADSWHVVHCIDKPYTKYAYETNVTVERLESYKTEYFKWENYDKPLKAASAYKVEELVQMCKQLTPDKPLDKKLGKKELYELLLVHF